MTTNPTIRIVVRYLAGIVTGAAGVSAVMLDSAFGTAAVEAVALIVSAAVAVLTERAYAASLSKGETK